MSSETQNVNFVLVITEHHNVFAGFMEKLNNRIITLTRARHIVQHPNCTFANPYNLATKGPNQDWVIGDAMAILTLTNVISIIQYTPQAYQAWKTWENKK